MSNISLKEYIDDAAKKFLSIEGDQIMRWMAPEIISCNEEKREIVVKYGLEPRFANPSGVVLHGGLTAAYFDSAMGLLSSYYAEGMVNTVSLDTNYCGPILVESPILIRAKLARIGHTIAFTTAEAFQEKEPNRTLATSSATFYISPKKEKIV